MKIRKNDKVKIIKGKDRGKSGKVLKVFSDAEKILVEGINLYKKHLRPKREGEKGEIVLVPRPVSVANMAIECSACGKPARVGFMKEGEKKMRICKKCQARMD